MNFQVDGKALWIRQCRDECKENVDHRTQASQSPESEDPNSQELQQYCSYKSQEDTKEMKEHELLNAVET